MADLPLRKLAEDATTITLGWDPVYGGVGYRFSREKGGGKASHTWDPSRSSVRFAKDSAWYKVDALTLAASGEYPPPPPPPVTGRLLFMPKLGPATDSYLNGADTARKAYVNDKLDMPMAYVDNWASWLPSQQYFDIEVGAYNRNHPDHSGAPPLTDQQKAWICKDDKGTLLFIRWGSSVNGQLPQYAADWGNPDFRNYAKGVVNSILAKHPGVHFDDANSWPNLGYGNGSSAPAFDSHGKPISREQWADNLCTLLEEIRAEHPQAFLSANQWWSDSYPKNDGSDPYVQRTAKAMSMMAKEQGLTDTGLTGGTGQWSIDRLFKWADAIHAAGANVWWMSYASSAADVEANCAAYWCTWQPGDSLSGGSWWQTWPTVYDIDLGDPKGPYTYTGGVHRREFTRGHVEVASDRTGRVVAA